MLSPSASSSLNKHSSPAISGNKILRPNNQASHQDLRRHLRAARRALPVFAQKKSAQQLAMKLFSLPVIKKARHIALYWPVDGEISPLLLRRLQKKTFFYLPVIKKFPANTLSFMRWHKNKPLLKNRFGIAEPVGGEKISPKKMQVIVLPLTGFDAQGNRLGMGGGFYDRSLSRQKIPPQKKIRAKKTVLIGVAHACQQVPALMPAKWDVALDLMVTDKKIIIPRR